MLLLLCVCVFARTSDLRTELRQKVLDGEKQSGASSQLQMRFFLEFFLFKAALQPNVTSFVCLRRLICERILISICPPESQ